MTDAARLAQIRASHAAIAPGMWSRAVDGEGREFVEARGDMGELLPVLTFHPGASTAERDFVTEAPEAIGFLLGLVERAARKVRALSGQAEPETRAKAGKDYAAEAAMKCAEPSFKRFLMEKHGLESPATDERVAQKVRSLCGVSSRRALNENGKAADRWTNLRRAFDAWRRAG